MYHIFFILLLIATTCMFCCSPSLRITRETMTHMIALNSDGSAHEFIPLSSNKSKGGKPYNYNQHICEIVKSIKSSKKNSILIYIHGGMKSLPESIADAEEQTKIIEHTSGYYPIYINWESSMVDAYAEQLVYIRQGKYSPLMGPISAPFYLLADIGRAIVRAPITWGHQGFNLITRSLVLPAAADTIAIKFSRDYYPEEVRIYLGLSNRDTGEEISSYLTHFSPGLVKILTTPLMDTFGKSSWENMRRRTKKVFRKTDEFNLYDINKTNVKNIRSTGGVAVLMDSLTNLLRDKDYDITLIGHSMGCMIINELVYQYKDLHFSNIIMMAPACTIRDFEHIIIPYLQMPENKRTQLYILTLHPEAEARENTYRDLVPRGSLLEWVDDFASQPTEFTEVTLGKWENIIRAVHIIPEDVRAQITIKGFGYRYGTDPQTHGEFNNTNQKFWDSDFWKIPDE